MNESWEIRVSRQDLAVSEIGAGVDHDVALDEEQVLFAIDSFAMTANNVTYAVMGDAMKYWNFFPTVDGWGIVPVWGFADVVGSAHPGVAVGDRYYGYWPTARNLVVVTPCGSPIVG